MDSNLIEQIARGYADFAAGDIDAARVPFSPDVEWIEPPQFPHGGTYHGPDAVQGYLEASRAGWREIESRPRRVLVNERKVATLVEHRGIRSDGAPARVVVLDVFEVDGGQVVRMEAFADATPADWLAQ